MHLLPVELSEDHGEKNKELFEVENLDDSETTESLLSFLLLLLSIACRDVVL